MRWKVGVLLPLFPAFWAYADTVLFRNGDSLQGRLLAIDTNQIVSWEHPTLGRTIDFSLDLVDYISLDLEPATPTSTNLPPAIVVYLNTSEKLVGSLIGSEKNHIVWRTPAVGRVSIRKECISAIRTQECSHRHQITNEQLGAWVILQDGTRVAGTLDQADHERLSIRTDYGVLQIPVPKLCCLTYPPSARCAPESSPATLDILLFEGTQLFVKIQSWREGHLTAVHNLLGKLQIPGTSVRTIRCNRSGFLRFKALIDGRDRIHIRHDELWFTHESWKPPGVGDHGVEPVYVNNTAWEPTWNGEISSRFKPLVPPLPHAGSWRFHFKPVRGRGELNFIQHPNQTNRFEAIILVDDSHMPAQDWYEFELSWEPQ